MNIASTQYNFNKKALEIYVSGCSIKCQGCHNPELQNFGHGDNLAVASDSILKKITEFDCFIENIFILGGEPLVQRDIYSLLEILRPTGKKIYLFTGFELQEAMKLNNVYNFLSMIDFIKTGRYEENLRSDKIKLGFKLASSNQEIYRVIDGEIQ